MSEEQEVKEQLLHRRIKSPIKAKDLLSSGSTLLNLACSNRIVGAFAKGHYYYFVGDSKSGKTFLCLTSLAEASINPVFDDYQIIFDDVEHGALMDIKHFFGKKVAERLRPPAGTRDEPKYSATVEDFYFNVMDALKRGPCIYILDSMDALDAEEDLAHFEKRSKSRFSKKEDKKVAGTYGVGKPKRNSTDMRKVCSKLRKTGSILIVIGQTRDNIGTFTFEKKTRSGGHALTFYATLEIWSSTKEMIKKKVMDKNRNIGRTSKCRIKKNRISGRDRTIEVDMYETYGIDDIGSCIKYLIDEGHWEGNTVSVTAPEFDFPKGKIEKLAQKIDSEGDQQELKLLVAKVWADIEDACAVRRKARYE